MWISVTEDPTSGISSFPAFDWQQVPGPQDPGANLMLEMERNSSPSAYILVLGPSSVPTKDYGCSSLAFGYTSIHNLFVGTMRRGT